MSGFTVQDDGRVSLTLDPEDMNVLLMAIGYAAAAARDRPVDAELKAKLDGLLGVLMAHERE